METPVPPAIQRTASLIPLAGLLAELGTSLDAVLAGTGVTPHELRPDHFIAYAAYLAILDNAARITGRDDFGLLLGSCQTLAALGPLGRVMRHAATLGEALNAFVTFQIGNSTGSTVYLVRTGTDMNLGYGIYDAEGHVSPIIHDVVVAVGCKIVAELTHGSVMPEEIFTLRRPPDDLSPYRGLGLCPIRFGQSQTGLVFNAADMRCRLPDADETLHNAALAELAPELAVHRDTKARVRHVLRHLLVAGASDMGNVAKRLDLHPRALRRQLQLQQTSFKAIKDAIRHAVACELLALDALDVADIAQSLDYGTHSAFDHAFRRWTAMSPTDWRGLHRLDGDRTVHGAPLRIGRPSAASITG